MNALAMQHTAAAAVSETMASSCSVLFNSQRNTSYTIAESWFSVLDFPQIGFAIRPEVFLPNDDRVERKGTIIGGSLLVCVLPITRLEHVLERQS